MKTLLIKQALKRAVGRSACPLSLKPVIFIKAFFIQSLLWTGHLSLSQQNIGEDFKSSKEEALAVLQQTEIPPHSCGWRSSYRKIYYDKDNITDVIESFDDDKETHFFLISALLNAAHRKGGTGSDCGYASLRSSDIDFLKAVHLLLFIPDISENQAKAARHVISHTSRFNKIREIHALRCILRPHKGDISDEEVKEVISVFDRPELRRTNQGLINKMSDFADVLGGCDYETHHPVIPERNVQRKTKREAFDALEALNPFFQENFTGFSPDRKQLLQTAIEALDEDRHLHFSLIVTLLEKAAESASGLPRFYFDYTLHDDIDFLKEASLIPLIPEISETQARAAQHLIVNTAFHNHIREDRVLRCILNPYSGKNISVENANIFITRFGLMHTDGALWYLNCAKVGLMIFRR